MSSIAPLLSPPDVHSDAARSDYLPFVAESAVGHLASTGFGIGGVAGALLGAAAVGIASLATEVILPGTTLHAAGPMVAMLLGAGAGAANGGLVGALVGWGIPVEVDAAAGRGEAKRSGSGVCTVLCPDR